jgi:glycosyltransferase involved in cell wall biosynthesis
MSATMRILLVHVRYRSPGGEDVVVRAEAELLRAAGHDVLVYELENPHGARTAPALARAPWDRRGARALAAKTQHFQADVVHVHNTWFALSPAIVPVLRESGRPLVMTLHNYRLLCADGTLWRDGAVCRDCVGRGAARGVLHACYRDSRVASAFAAATIASGRVHHAWDGIDTFIAPSATVRDVHIDAGIDARRIVVKPHFMTDLGARDAAPSTSRTIVYAGRLTPSKGVARLLDAWRIASRDLDGFELLIVGDGPLRAELEARAPSGVRFLGACTLDETRAHIKAARAFAFPSEWLEPFGLVLLEAMVSGTPVVGHDVASTADIVGDAGHLVPPGAPDALADALRAMRDDALVDTLGTTARARYVARYTPEANLPQLVAIYENAIKR